MSRVNYQHYVPRFYLEGFQSKSRKVWCYDKKLDKAYQQSPDRLGGETLFYDVPKADKVIGISQFLEKWFNPLEGDAAKTLREWRERLSSSNTFSPTADEMEIVATFMVVQQMRTPRGRRLAVDTALVAAKVSFFNWLAEEDPELATKIENPVEDLILEMPKERWAYAHANLLMDISTIEELAAILLKHIWLVTETKNQHGFYTSDHPVVQVPHVKHPIRSMSGLRSPGIQILYPLMPNFTLNLLERTFWRHCERHHRKLVRPAPEKSNIEFENSAQVIHSARFIYSRDGNFDLARDMCRETSELRNPDQPEMASRRGSEPHSPAG